MADVVVCDGKIVQIAPEVAVAEGDKVVDCAGKVVMSGLVDLHVHLREPGFEAKVELCMYDPADNRSACWYADGW